MYEQTRRWVKAGHEVTVVTAPYEKSDIRSKGGFISRQQVEGINLIVIDAADNNRHPVWKRAWNALLFSLISVYFALFQKYDVLIASSGPITVGLPMLMAKIFRRKKTVFEVRDLWPEGGIQLGKIKGRISIKLAQWFERCCYRYADFVVAASPGMEKSINGILPAKPTLMIPNASDVALFNIEKTYPDTFPDKLKGFSIIIYAGSLGLMDECTSAIKAMTHLKTHKLALIFLGEGSERTTLEKLAKATGNPHILFLGLLPKTEVVKWYSVASASIVGFKNFPVLWTSSPNKMFDSFASGVPVIQNTPGWIKDLVEQHRCGINVSYENIPDYVTAFLYVCEHPEQIKFMGENAFRLAQTVFNRDLLSEQYLNHLTLLYENRLSVDR